MPPKQTEKNEEVVCEPRPGNQSGSRVADSKLPNSEVFPPTAVCSFRRERASPGPRPGNQSESRIRSRDMSIVFGPEYFSWDDVYPKSTCNFAPMDYTKTPNDNDNNESQNRRMTTSESLKEHIKSTRSSHCRWIHQT